MKKMSVMLAEENQSYECFIDESNKHWNGWLNPYFNKENKDKFIKDMLKDLEDKVFSDNKNICVKHKLMSDLLSREFNNKLGFHSMETEELLKFFFDFVNGKTEYMFSGFPSDVKNEIVENVLGFENYEFINELYETEEHNNLYYFGSCYCWIEKKEGVA